MQKILLDTHIFVWIITEEKKISKNAHTSILEAIPHNQMLLSQISLWEIAMLVRKDRLKLSMPIRTWIRQALTTPGLALVPLTPEILIESCELPGKIHNDPVDRMIVSTARIENAILITRDQAILDYATSGSLLSLKG
jgi:PIN domain nuclease of toxin-antitoxin system